MRKIVEWLFVLSLIFAIWVSKLIGIISVQSKCVSVILNWLPFYLLLVIGTVSVVIVLYRTFNFNDCPEASTELMKLVNEAKRDLAHRGFTLDS
ncbi:hypothetical protein MN116_005035 [Schistosoma mekongi]|uniref:Dolichol-phosphate mannosyltransferase subunit 3 n=1 Tax=Schistosoma mekongi TaxID=38744 RepID=A0AAE2D676_SCHME|nr:hypothetical protein MN116_005035 [Schistosoma mekongi]